MTPCGMQKDSHLPPLPKTSPHPDPGICEKTWPYSWGSPISRIQCLIIWGAADGITLETKCVINGVILNQCKTMPALSLVSGRTVFYETSLWHQNGWRPLSYRTKLGLADTIKWRTWAGNLSWMTQADSASLQRSCIPWWRRAETGQTERQLGKKVWPDVAGFTDGRGAMSKGHLALTPAKAKWDFWPQRSKIIHVNCLSP